MSGLPKITTSDNLPTRDGLLKALSALGTSGISIGNIFTFPDYISVFFTLDTSYYSNPERAEEVKLDVLRALTAIEGISLSCNVRGHLL